MSDLHSSKMPQHVQHNYTPPDTQDWSERVIRDKIALYGVSQIVHKHAINKPCNEKCKIYLTVEDMPQALSTMTL